MSTANFYFRIWHHPEDPPDIEVWFNDLEETKPGRCFVSDWARESLCCEDFVKLFEIDEDNDWQIVGEATISGSFDYYGEYDEWLDIISYKKCKVDEGFFNDCNSLRWPIE